MGIYEIILNMNSGLLIFLLALIVNIFSTLVYKKTTDQKEIKKLKKKQKEMQKEIKNLQNQPEKAMKKQKEMMEISGTLMKSSMKPMIYTMIPLLLLFGWINASLIYEPLAPNEPFLVTAKFAEGSVGDVTISSTPALNVDEATKTITNGEVQWTLSGDLGNYFLQFNGAGFEQNKKIVISDSSEYEDPIQKYEGSLKEVEVGNKRVRPFGNFSLFGWKPGMLGAYILLSIVLSLIIRKLFKVA